MRSLILVDLDNVHKWFISGLNEMFFNKRSKRTTREAVVVMGLNTCTARHMDQQGFSKKNEILDIAKEIVKFFEPGASLAGVEVVLCLTAPEAVDDSLLAVVGSTSTKSCGGRFERVWLVSQDQGLAESLSERLHGRLSHCHLKPVKKTVFTFGHLKYSRVVVSCKKDDPGPSAATAAMPRYFCLPIDTPEKACWATRQKIQVSGTIGDIANQVEQLPSLLTQVSVTRNAGKVCVAGVTRLMQALEHHPGTSRPLIGKCEPGDGLEIVDIEQFQAKPGKFTVARVEESTLGRGAVRLFGESQHEELMVTARTSIPQPVVAEVISGAKAPWTIEAKLDDSVVLAMAYNSNIRVVGKVGRCKFVRWKTRAFCEVDPESTGPWWLTPAKRSGTAKLQLHDKLRYLLPKSLVLEDIACQARVIEISGRHHLVLASPIGAGGPVRVLDALDRNQIGPAIALGNCDRGKELRCAVLAVEEPVLDGEEIMVVPIQDVDPVMLAKSLRIENPAEVKNLMLLPLVVPIQPASLLLRS